MERIDEIMAGAQPIAGPAPELMPEVGQ